MSQYPQREGEQDCRDFLRTGRCKYGESCKYHHPIGGLKTSSDPNEPLFPIRPDEPPCQYYLKHGTCKFGQTCKFHHPAHIVTGGSGATVYMNLGNVNLLAPICGPCGQNYSLGNGLQLLPQRPGEANCIYFLRNGRCKYGATCKYHHPTNTFNVEQNTSRSSIRHTQTRNGIGRSIADGSLSDMMKQHQPRMNSKMEEGPVATHVLYSSGEVVPVNQASSYHLSGNNVSPGYVPENVRRKEEGKRRQGSNAMERNKIHVDTSKYDDMKSSIFNNSFSNVGSFQPGTVSTSPNEPSLEWSSVSTSSSIHSNENSFDDDSTKHPQDFVSNDIYERTNEPVSSLHHNGNMELPKSMTSHQSSSTSQPPSFDDGLSKMTSALLTMLDSPEEYDERTRPFYSDASSNHGSQQSLTNGLKSRYDLQDPSNTWFSNFTGLESGAMKDASSCDHLPSRVNSYY